ncbi:MAG: carbohydrate porin [Candidatus Omnitrophica bacterium]|nr:carbohydrate porin [Candidatus Omnitrophota bacterium]
MFKKVARYTLAFFVVLLMLNPSYAEEVSNEELVKEIQALKARVAELEKKLSAQTERSCKLTDEMAVVKEKMITCTPGEGIIVEGAGLSIGAGVTFVAQGTPDANNTGGTEDDVFDAEFTADVEIEKEFDDWGLAFLHLEAGQNDGIEGGLSLFSNVNRDAGDTGASFDATEWWYEHYFLDKDVILRVGKMDASCFVDQNEYAHCEITQFLGRIFRNSPAVEFPSDNAFGANIHLCVEPLTFAEFEAGYYEADADWENIFDNPFYTAQVNIKPVDLSEESLRSGNYRIYGWINDRHHTKLVDLGSAVSTEREKLNYGFGISCDQELADGIGIFGRYGWQRPDIMPADATAGTPPDMPTVEHAWSAGIEISGTYWMRDDDALGFAVGQAFPSGEYDDAGGGDSAEGHIETYYSCKINDCLTLSPDLQLIWNPNGIDDEPGVDDDAIFVYGLRGQFDF